VVPSTSLEILSNESLNLGEGPISYGLNHEKLAWVDILGRKIVHHNLATGEEAIELVESDISFLIPQRDGKLLLGTNPWITSESNSQFRLERDLLDSEPIRWNDAKVGPCGELWVGTMAYAETSGAGALYRWISGQSSPTKIISGVTVANGLAWSGDNKKMFFIDSPSRSLHIFPYADGRIAGKPEIIKFPESYGYPDGMTIDAEDGLWIAFWNGAAVRRFDSNAGCRESHIINTPVARTTSCTFAGTDLFSLVITTAHREDPSAPQEAGKTFICQPGFAGLATRTLQI
jgi:sugar lactone lactonase YvrE